MTWSEWVLVGLAVWFTGSLLFVCGLTYSASRRCDSDNEERNEDVSKS